jgi:23S rRNA pseudouridine2605 synthase
LPKYLPRVVTIGRLDLNTEGLLLLTNDGDLARALELPATGLARKYRARAFGKVQQRDLDKLRDGIEYDGVEYRSIIARLDRIQGSNSWIDMTLTEGKKREARRALESIGLKVNRLIRVTYGPIELLDLAVGEVDEISAAELLAMFPDLVSERRRPDPFHDRRPDRGSQGQKPPREGQNQKPHGKKPSPKARPPSKQDRARHQDRVEIHGHEWSSKRPTGKGKSPPRGGRRSDR